MSLRSSRSLLAIAPAIIVLIVALTALRAGRGVTGAVDAVDHTRRVLAASEELLRFCLDAETGVRAYVATGDSVFLDPVRGSREASMTRLAEIRKLTADNTEQLSHVNALAAAVESSLDHIAEIQGMVQNKTLAPANAAPILFRGKSFMDTVRSRVAAIEAAEDSALAARRGRLDSGSRTSALVIALGALVAIIASVLVNLFLTRLITEREQMARELELQLGDLDRLRTN